MTREEYIEALRKMGYKNDEIMLKLNILEKLRSKGINLSYEDDFKLQKKSYIKKPTQY